MRVGSSLTAIGGAGATTLAARGDAPVRVLITASGRAQADSQQRKRFTVHIVATLAGRASLRTDNSGASAFVDVSQLVCSTLGD
jgi:hypothetical protein